MLPDNSIPQGRDGFAHSSQKCWHWQKKSLARPWLAHAEVCAWGRVWDVWEGDICHICLCVCMCECGYNMYVCSYVLKYLVNQFLLLRFLLSFHWLCHWITFHFWGRREDKINKKKNKPAFCTDFSISVYVVLRRKALQSLSVGLELSVPGFVLGVATAVCELQLCIWGRVAVIYRWSLWTHLGVFYTRSTSE